jgi:calcitonin receptor, putative (fragment)
MLLDPISNKLYTSNQTQELKNTFLVPSTIQKWQQCCEEAIICCLNFIKNDHKYGDKNACPKTWDGWTCWSQTAYLGSTIKKPCPDHIYWNEYRRPPCMGKC